MNPPHIRYIERTYNEVKKVAKENKMRMIEVIDRAVEEYVKMEREYKEALNYLLYPTNTKKKKNTVEM